MATKEISTKRAEIVRTNARMVIIVGVASFVTVFCLVASRTVLNQNNYEKRVISATQTAKDQLTTDIQTASQLVKSYQTFDGASSNIIGGSKTGTGSNDGDNAKIILDALPSSYDFPALTSSLQSLLSGTGFTLSDITGTDNETTESSTATGGTSTPVSIPFSFDIADANYTSLQQIIANLQDSIRPMSIDTLEITGGGNTMTMSVTAHTYYQPGTNLTINKQVVK